MIEVDRHCRMRRLGEVAPAGGCILLFGNRSHEMGLGLDSLLPPVVTPSAKRTLLRDDCEALVLIASLEPVSLWVLLQPSPGLLLCHRRRSTGIK